MVDGDSAPVGAAEPEEFPDGDGTLAKSTDKIRLRDYPAVDQRGDENPVRFPEGTDPHAPGIVNMAGDHPGSAARCTRDAAIEECSGQTGEEQTGDTGVGRPSGK